MADKIFKSFGTEEEFNAEVEKLLKEKLEAEKKKYAVQWTQEEFDNNNAKIRKETEKKILKKLNAKKDDDGEGSHNDDDDDAKKKQPSEEFLLLKKELDSLKNLFAESANKSIVKSKGVKDGEVDLMFKMAKGLVSEDVNFEKALETVLTATGRAVKTQGLPKENTVTVEGFLKESKNPFAKESFNLSKQGELFEKNPDLAKQLRDAAKT